MPINELGMNDDYITYFSLEEYIDKIRLLDDILYHLEDTSKNFDEYIKILADYQDEDIIFYWIKTMQEEMHASQNIENLSLNERILQEKGIFFDSLNVTHKRIHDIHNFVMSSADSEYEPSFTYRKVPVKISTYDFNSNKEIIYWRGANPEVVNKFMNEYLKVYKQNKISFVYSNPFINAALMSLIFNRIHPYKDGNGRTSRMIYNIKFTENINKYYQTKLMLCPLNISNRILANKKTYVNRINHIYFNNENDTNKEINSWFEFILNMIDEQLYYNKNKLQERIELNGGHNYSDYDISKKIKQMKLSKLK